MFCKIEDDRLIICPQNGFLNDGRAISNLPKFFENNPDVAKEHGFYLFEEKMNMGSPVKYIVEDEKIKAIYESEV